MTWHTMGTVLKIRGMLAELLGWIEEKVRMKRGTGLDLKKRPKAEW